MIRGDLSKRSVARPGSTNRTGQCATDLIADSLVKVSSMSVGSPREKTLSSIAAVVSAFLVFVVGGGVLLSIWTSQRAEAEAAALLAEEEAMKAAQAEARRLEAEAAAKAEAEAAKASKKRRRSRRSSSSKAVKTARVEAVAPTSEVQAKPSVAVEAAKTAKQRQRRLTGKGKVLIRGDATRVRLMGTSGVFGAGSLPAGTYTVQATFPGFDPRMAGTVEIEGGKASTLICSSSTKSCSIR